MNASLSLESGKQASDGIRLVGLERHYHCDSCAAEHRSWSRVRTCPSCGETLSAARIRRAVVA